MANDLPTFAASNYSSSTRSIQDLWADNGMFVGDKEDAVALNVTGLRPFRAARLDSFSSITEPSPVKELIMAAAVGRRVVQVFVSDPNPQLPLEMCLLYKGDVQVTESTDQELYFELDIRKLLTDHNEKRIKVVDKTIKDRTEYLEPAKIRDLKMSVVTITNL